MDRKYCVFSLNVQVGKTIKADKYQVQYTWVLNMNYINPVRLV